MFTLLFNYTKCYPIFCFCVWKNEMKFNSVITTASMSVSHHPDLWTWEQELLFGKVGAPLGLRRLPAGSYLTQSPCKSRRTKCLWSVWSLCKPRAATAWAVVVLWETVSFSPETDVSLWDRRCEEGHSCSRGPLGWTSTWSVCRLCSYLPFLWLSIHLSF